ncbi:hypothetical protein NL676_037099 [Syzygium grande]|nr:hypothetical protein NL676_037099 [Syzygium grande]
MTPRPMTARHDECDSRTVFETVNGSYTFVITNFSEAQSQGVGQRGVRHRALFDLRLEDQNGNGNHQVFTLCHHPLVKGPHTLVYRENMRGYPRFLKRDDPEALHYIKDDHLILHCIVGVVKAKVEGPRHYRVTISLSDVDVFEVGRLRAPGEQLPFGLLLTIVWVGTEAAAWSGKGETAKR